MSLEVDEDQVRAAINISLTEADLSNDTIGLPIYSGAALLEVKRRDPSWASRTGDALMRLSNAANLITAALLLPALREVKSAKTAEGDAFEMFAPSLEGPLWDRAAEEIAIAIGEDPSSGDRPTMFTLARAGRPRRCFR
jgi:hypothetical protein